MNIVLALFFFYVLPMLVGLSWQRFMTQRNIPIEGDELVCAVLPVYNLIYGVMCLFAFIGVGFVLLRGDVKS